jgi:hypothetical protein
MKMNLPTIDLKPDDRVWLEALYRRFKSSRSADPREIKAELAGKIGNDFEILSIPPWLTMGGRGLTVLGMYTIHPDEPIIPHVHELLREVRAYLLTNPTVQSIDLNDLQIPNGMSAQQKASILSLVRDFADNAWYLAEEKSAERSSTLSTIKIAGEVGFDWFYKYTSLEELVLRKLKPLRNESFPRPWPSQALSVFTPNTAFILMQINKEDGQSEDVHQAVKEVFEEYGITAVRADDIEHSDKITDVVLDRIERSEYVFVDLTNERPNVYYEVGYAQGKGKRPIFYRRKGTSLHFDLAGYNVPEYASATQLKALLRARLESMTGSGSRTISTSE